MRTSQLAGTSLIRARVGYALLLVVFAIFVVRLFYLQVIRHDYYQKAALSSQLKEYEIPAARGVIEAHDGDDIIPIVLNETRYTLFADPKFVTDPAAAAQAVAKIIGGKTDEYEQKMRIDTRYSVLAKKISKDQKTKLDELEFKGIGTRDEPQRIYPQGQLAAQILGFVNDEGAGAYGVEEALNDQLTGTPGQLKAITDASGVPLVSSADNIISQPDDGKRVVLTVDVSLQRKLEDALRAGLEAARSNSGSALILDSNSGAVKAMANYPTYNPAEFFKQKDVAVFSNAAVSSPLEVGSVMKVLTAAAAIDQGVVNKDTTYYDPSRYTIDGAVVSNIEEDGGAATRSVTDILTYSLNTGATWLLMQMGGGELNKQGRATWHDYLTNRYRFGTPTGIEQGYEAEGVIPDPNDGFGLNIRYANTAFGQGMTATPLQMAAAVAAAVNGGTYYQPHLVDGYVNEKGTFVPKTPEIVNKNVVSAETSAQVRTMMEAVIARNYLTYSMNAPAEIYSVGGKTGTAEIARPEGGYYADRFNGTFVGYVGGDRPEYIIMVRVDEPGIGGYAGSKAAAPIFGSLAQTLMNDFGVTPRSR